MVFHVLQYTTCIRTSTPHPTLFLSTTACALFNALRTAQHSIPLEVQYAALHALAPHVTSSPSNTLDITTSAALQHALDRVVGSIGGRVMWSSGQMQQLVGWLRRDGMVVVGGGREHGGGAGEGAYVLRSRYGGEGSMLSMLCNVYVRACVVLSCAYTQTHALALALAYTHTHAFSINTPTPTNPTRMIAHALATGDTHTLALHTNNNTNNNTSNTTTIQSVQTMLTTTLDSVTSHTCNAAGLLVRACLDELVYAAERRYGKGVWRMKKWVG